MFPMQPTIAVWFTTLQILAPNGAHLGTEKSWLHGTWSRDATSLYNGRDGLSYAMLCGRNQGGRQDQPVIVMCVHEHSGNWNYYHNKSGKPYSSVKKSLY